MLVFTLYVSDPLSSKNVIESFREDISWVHWHLTECWLPQICQRNSGNAEFCFVSLRIADRLYLLQAILLRIEIFPQSHHFCCRAVSWHFSEGHKFVASKRKRFSNENQHKKALTRLLLLVCLAQSALFTQCCVCVIQSSKTDLLFFNWVASRVVLGFSFRNDCRQVTYGKPHSEFFTQKHLTDFERWFLADKYINRMASVSTRIARRLASTSRILNLQPLSSLSTEGPSLKLHWVLSVNLLEIYSVQIYIFLLLISTQDKVRTMSTMRSRGEAEERRRRRSREAQELGSFLLLPLPLLRSSLLRRSRRRRRRRRWQSCLILLLRRGRRMRRRWSWESPRRIGLGCVTIGDGW